MLCGFFKITRVLSIIVSHSLYTLFKGIQFRLESGHGHKVQGESAAFLTKINPLHIVMMNNRFGGGEWLIL